ncbi:hypothetical protein BDY24DRAFT_72785 [Mrakia frigida]|uniref:arrestin family protein n=1 Tax=Mrakia frigida TaxID=29902 RepID=UPI003FCC0AD8
MVKNGVHIELTEPVVFLRGPATGEDSRGRRTLQRDDVPPALLRGVLTLTLTKPSRIKRIDIVLEGKARTEWPEGIGARRTEVHEEHTIFEATTNFFTAARSGSASRTRRATSIGPGIIGDRETDVEDWDTSIRNGIAGLLHHHHPHGGPVASGSGGGAGAGEGVVGGAEMDGLGGERGRGRDPRTARSQSVLPSSRSTVHSRRPSFDNEHPNGSGEEDALGGRSSTTSYPTRFRFEDPAADRGPSPAYTPQGSPPTHSLSLPHDGSAPRVSASPSGLPSILSPIQSAYPSASTSRDSSRSTDPHVALMGLTATLEEESMRPSTPSSGQRPVRPPISNQVSFVTSSSTSTSTSNSLYRESSETNRRDSFTPTLNADQYSSGTPPASAVPSLEPFHTRQDTPPSSLRRVSYNLANGGTSSNSSSPSGRQVPLPRGEDYHSPSSSRRNSRDLSIGTVNGSNLPLNPSSSSSSSHPPSPSPNHLDEPPTPKPRAESRSRSRFKFSGVGSALRGISQDIKDQLSHSSSHNRSSSRSEYFPPSADGVEEYPPHGRGGSGKMPRGRRQSPTRGGSELATTEERSASRTRGRAAGMKKLRGGAAGSDDEEEGGKDDEEAGWKEFRKGSFVARVSLFGASSNTLTSFVHLAGVYHYPISFTIPVSTPPTIHADFGSVVYRLKAVVHRAGALTSNLNDEKEVRMVATPGEDDTEETENVVVERQWEEQLRYLVALSGKSFPIGGQIPISIRLMPLEKVKIYRISVLLEEKIDYFAHDKKVARHEATRRYQLLALRHPAPGNHNPILPIISDASDAISSSPLAALAMASATSGMDADDATSQLLSPTGPWVLDQLLQVPDCSSKISFTTKHAKTNMTVAHWLKVVFRVERGGDDDPLDAKGKKKQCRCNLQYISLPSYEVLSAGLRQDASIATCTCKTSAEQAFAHRSLNQPQTQSTLVGVSIPSSSPGGPTIGAPPSFAPSRHTHSPAGSPRYLMEENTETVQERSEQFARLVSGQETAQGEIPPSYDDALAGPNATSRIMTYTRGVSNSRSRSRAPAASSSATTRTASPLPPPSSRNSSRSRGPALGLF